MTHYKIPLSYNSIDSDRLHEVLCKYGERHHNELITDFERAVAKKLQVKYAVALNSGTAAIHLGLLALGVTRGDEVFVSTFTYVASVNPILYLGARPVFIDSEPDSWNLDPELLHQALEEAIRENRKPKAIIVVHAYGMPAQMDRILELATYYQVPVLEDAAEALGSTWKGKPVGGLGEVGIISFNNNKIITTFGGGMMLSNDAAIYQKAVLLAAQARENRLFYYHEKVGFSYVMGPVNAAIGLSQLDSLSLRVDRRIAVFQKYRQILQDCGGHFACETSQAFSNRWLSTFAWKDDEIRGAVSVPHLMEYFEKAGIEARLLWNPMHLQPVFKDFRAICNNVSETLFKKGICLPSGENVDDQSISSVIEVVTTFLKSVSTQ